MVITGEQLQQLATTSGVDPEVDFKERLIMAAENFTSTFEKWVEKEALETAKRGRRQTHRKYPLSFHERVDGFRVSTYVKGFRTSDGGFDPSRFVELGYTPEAATPFLKACAFLQNRGIVVEDVSDPSKGLGFWLRISF